MSIPQYQWKSLSAEEKQRIFGRSESDIRELIPTVEAIATEVAQGGDAALRAFTKKFDNADLEALPIEVQAAEFEAAERALNDEVKAALDYCIENTFRFHRSQVPQAVKFHEIRPGILAGERWSPIDSVGLYVPRGRGSFPSMLYMLGVPALLAGVPTIAVVTPPNPDGSVDPACLYAARRIGLHRVFRIGGAQAIAALAYGTESVPRVLKVVGPGSAYVSAAKRLLSDRLEPGLPAGPSESMLWADDSADPERVAVDLLIEAEHGSDSAALLVTESPALAAKIAETLPKIIQETPEPRRTYLAKVFSEEGYGGILVTENAQESAQVINEYAPEHLSIQTRSPWDSQAQIRNAGEILLGPFLPFSAANYATGANAVLPTGGNAKTWSSVSVRDFSKSTSIVQTTSAGYEDLKQHVQVLAQYEGFPRHKAAFSIERGTGTQ